MMVTTMAWSKLTWHTRTMFALLCVVVWIRPSLQSGDDSVAITITLTAINVQVDEIEDRLTRLGADALITCVDEDPTRAYISSMTPTAPCTLRCFQIRACGTAAGEFCLYFVPGQGSLTYATAIIYTLSIACTDDVEAAATSDVTVTVVSNTPPTYNPAAPLSVTDTESGTATAANTVIYDVNSIDIDNDPVYYSMSTNPYTDYFRMGYSDGKVYTTNNLLYLCEATVDATVSITDQVNPSVGPFSIAFTIDPQNTAPTTTDLDTIVSFDENTAAGTVVHPITVTDDGTGGTVLKQLRSTSSSGLEMYELTAAGIALKIDADYERADTRSVQLYVDMTDGYCNSKTYGVTMKVLDVNEAPDYHPELLIFLTVYEGDINEVVLDVWDEDIGDTFTYSRSAGHFQMSVDTGTGAVISSATADIDPNTQVAYRWVRAEVTDSGGLSDIALVDVEVKDANDNPPVFAGASYVLGAHPCLDLGTAIGTLAGSDLDSIFENNNAFHFYGGGGRMAVTSDGQVILTQQCVEGQVTVGTANIRDHGEYPNHLDGTPASLSLICSACPPPATVAPAATTAAPATTTTAAPTVSVSSDDDEIYVDDFLAWLIPAAILALLWLVLTIFFLYRYCRPCNCTSKPKPAPRVKPEKPKPQQPKTKPKPPEPAKPKPATPPPPPKPKEQPKPDPYMFGFWKERYTDQDIKGQKPTNQQKPTAVEEMPTNIVRGNEPPPENLKLGQQATQPQPQATNAGPTGAQNAKPPKKSKTCAIL